MIPYPHFALPNLYVMNGYKVLETEYGPACEFERLDELEQCVRRVLLRKPRRLRGWDLRFIRNGLGLSQPEFGAFVSRDAQTVARWEKSNEVVEPHIDLVIRSRFAKTFESEMRVEELLSYVDGSARPLPEKIILTLGQSGWTYDFTPHFRYAPMRISGAVTLDMPAIRPNMLRVYESVFEREEFPVTTVHTPQLWEKSYGAEYKLNLKIQNATETEDVASVAGIDILQGVSNDRAFGRGR